MYEVTHTFDQLESGDVIRWNGRERTVTNVRPYGACVGGVVMSVNEINSLFKNKDVPFEVVA